MKPSPWAPFCVATRVAALAAAVIGVRSGGIGIALGVWAGSTLLRVPRRRLCIELFILWCAIGARVWLLTGVPLAAWPAAAGALASLAVMLLAPESGVLPLSGMDRFFVVQDYPGLPMNTLFFIDTAEPLDERALATSLGAMMDEVPMARTFVRQSVLGMQRFIARKRFVDPARLIVRAETPLENDSAPLDQPFDLSRQPPLRVVLTRRLDGRPRAAFVSHHTALDGGGGLLFLTGLFRRYREARGTHPREPLPEVAPPARLRDYMRKQGLGYSWRMIRKHVKPFAKVGARNATLHDDKKPQPTKPHYRFVDLDPATWVDLKAAAAEQGCTRNELLIAATLRTCNRILHERGQSGPPICVSSATSLRQQLGIGPGFQNFLGTMIVTLPPAEVERDNLPAVVAEKIAKLRTLDEALAYAVNLGVLTFILPPALLRAALKKLDADPESFFFTCLCSAMRAPSELQLPEVVERISTGSSIGRRPGIGITFTITDDKVASVLEWAHPIVSDETAALFVERFAEELRRFHAA